MTVAKQMRETLWALMLRSVPFGLALAGLGSLAGCDLPQSKAAPEKKKVEEARVLYSLPVVQEITDYENFAGRTDAVYTIDVRARVTGYLQDALFKDGDEVEKDAPLFKIDPRPYQAEVDRTWAAVLQNEAHLNRLERDRKRAQELLKRSAIGREEYDKIIGDAAEAEALLNVARAAHDMAELNLEFTDIKAPIAGRLSRKLVVPGNLVKQDETSLTTIVSQDPMYVYFDIDERTVLRLRRLVREGKIKSRQDGAEISVLLGLADEVGPDGMPLYPHEGTINFSDNKVDPSTGTLKVRGVIANPKPRILSPGLYVNVRLPIGKPHKAVLVSEQALRSNQDQKFVYIINDKDVALSRNVVVGRLEKNNLRVIESGLAPGARVIVSGHQRVREGKQVRPRLEGEEKKIVQPSSSSATPVAVRKRDPMAQKQAPRG